MSTLKTKKANPKYAELRAFGKGLAAYLTGVLGISAAIIIFCVVALIMSERPHPEPSPSLITLDRIVGLVLYGAGVVFFIGLGGTLVYFIGHIVYDWLKGKPRKNANGELPSLRGTLYLLWAAIICWGMAAACIKGFVQMWNDLSTL